MLLVLSSIISLSCILAQTTDSIENDSYESSTGQTTSGFGVPNNRNLQNAINNTIDNLNEIVAASSNTRNNNLINRAIGALRNVQRLSYDRDTLQQLSGEIRRLNFANTLYNSNNCDQTSSELDYDSLYDDLYDDDIDDSNDTDTSNERASTNVERVKRIMEAASEIIQDYCD